MRKSTRGIPRGLLKALAYLFSFLAGAALTLTLVYAFTGPGSNTPPSGTASVILPINLGGTGASTTAGARSNLAAAESGANTSITSLTPYTGNPIQLGSAGVKFNDGTVQTTAASGTGSQWITSGSNIYYPSTGDVGIGVNPSYAFQVSGTSYMSGPAYVAGTGAANGLFLNWANGGWTTIYGSSTSGDKTLYIAPSTSGSALNLAINGTPSAYFGNVCSGSATYFGLAVGNNGQADCTHYNVLSEGSNLFLNAPSGGYIDLRINNSAKLTITSAGNVSTANNLTVGGSTVYLNSTNNYWQAGSPWNVFETQYGGIELGPANSSYAHIYSTNSLPFYFNTSVYVPNLYLLTGGGIHFPDGTVQTTAAQ